MPLNEWDWTVEQLHLSHVSFLYLSPLQSVYKLNLNFYSNSHSLQSSCINCLLIFTVSVYFALCLQTFTLFKNWDSSWQRTTTSQKMFRMSSSVVNIVHCVLLWSETELEGRELIILYWSVSEDPLRPKLLSPLNLHTCCLQCNNSVFGGVS